MAGDTSEKKEGGDGKLEVFATESSDPKYGANGTATATAASTSALVGAGPGGHLASPSAKRRILAAYWILGLCNNYGYVVMISAAFDILAKNFHVGEEKPTAAPNPRDCNEMSTGAILLADIIPSLIIKFLSPFMPFWINLRMSLVVALNVAGFLLVAYAPELWVALAGVACMSFAAGLGEASLLAYTAFYKDKTVITMWSSGTGGAGVLGALSYAGLSKLFSPTDTLLVMISVPVAMALGFWVLMVHPRIDLDDEDSNDNIKGLPSSPKVKDDVPTQTTHASFADRLRDIPPLLRYIVPLTMVYLFEYFINQGLFEMIHYDLDWLEHAEQYRWFQVTYQIGVFVSRSSGSFFRIEKIWLLAVLQGLNVVYFTLEAVFNFSGYIWVVFAFVFWEGLLGGGAYVNTFFCISTKVPAEKREFSMAMSSVGDSIGISASGLIAIPVHNRLCMLPPPHSLLH